MIYFVQAERLRLIKIGYVDRFDLEGTRHRIKTFQIGSPDRLKLIAVAEGKKNYETTLHRRFKPIRVHGEWFEPSEELLGLVDLIRIVYARKVMDDLETCGFALRVEGQRLIVSPYSKLTKEWVSLIRFASPELLRIANEDPCRQDSIAS